MCCPKERGFNTRRNTHKPQKYGEAGDVRCCHVVEELGGCRKQRESYIVQQTDKEGDEKTSRLLT